MCEFDAFHGAWRGIEHRAEGNRRLAAEPGRKSFVRN
jgi:hypothetical protein